MPSLYQLTVHSAAVLSLTCSQCSETPCAAPSNSLWPKPRGALHKKGNDLLLVVPFIYFFVFCPFLSFKIINVWSVSNSIYAKAEYIHSLEGPVRAGSTLAVIDPPSLWKSLRNTIHPKDILRSRTDAEIFHSSSIGWWSGSHTVWFTSCSCP